MNKTQMCEYFVSEKKLMICYSFWTIHSFLRANLSLTLSFWNSQKKLTPLDVNYSKVNTL